MLRKDPSLPFPDTACSRRELVDFFNTSLAPGASPDDPISAANVKTMRYAPGRECVVLYELDPQGEAADRPAWAVATFSRLGVLRAASERHRAQPGAPAGRAALLPDYQCLIELFPHDWRLPSLRAAADPQQAWSLLAQASERVASTGPLPVEVDVVRYRPHVSCVFRYRLLPDAGGTEPQVIGKVYRAAGKAERVRACLEHLRRPGERGLHIPEPLALLTGSNLLLMEHASGRSLGRVLKDATAEEVSEVARLAAVVLATFHSLPVTGQRIAAPASDPRRLRASIARVDLVAPELASRMLAVLDAILRRLDTSPTPVVIHGDFKPSQLLLDGDRVAVVDFDRAGLGDPAVDVGSFMAQFHKEALDEERSYLRRLAPLFLTAYQEHDVVDALAERARLHQSLALVRMAVRRFFRAPYSYARLGGTSPQVRLLEEAAACLART